MYVSKVYAMMAETLSNRLENGFWSQYKNFLTQNLHMRALVKINNRRGVAIIDTGSDISLVSSNVLRNIQEVECLEYRGGDVRTANNKINVRGSVVLRVTVGVVDAYAVFAVAEGVNFNVILGSDFLYEYGISVSTVRNALVFEQHGCVLMPLQQSKPLSLNSCILDHDTILFPGLTAHVKVIRIKDKEMLNKYNNLNNLASTEDKKEESAAVFFVKPKDDKLLGLRVLEQLTDGVIEVQGIGGIPLYLPAGTKIAKAYPNDTVKEVAKVQSIGWDSGAENSPGEESRDKTSFKVKMVSHISVSRVGDANDNAVKEVTQTNIVEKVVSESEIPKEMKTGLQSDENQSFELKDSEVEEDVSNQDKDDVGQESNSLSTKRYYEVDGGFIPVVPSKGSVLKLSELVELRKLLSEFKDCFNDGTHPLKATNLIQARLDTGDAAPISIPPRRLSPAMREVVRKAVAALDAQVCFSSLHTFSLSFCHAFRSPVTI